MNIPTLRPPPRRAVVLATLFILRASIGQSQSLNGRVLEAGSDRAIAGVSLRLYDAQGITRAVAISDASGVFTIRAPTANRYQVRAERFGYQRLTTDFVELRADTATSMTIHLVPEGIPMDTLQVTARPKGLEPGSSQFARRCKARDAICFTGERIARSGAVKPSDVFESLPGFAVEEIYRRGEGTSTRIRSFHGWGCFQLFLNHHTRLPMDLNELLLTDVEGIEIYRSYREVPKELRESILGPMIWGCGVAIVWTKPAWK